MLRLIAEARARGEDVTTEAYPYPAGMTEIQSANLDDVYEGGPTTGWRCSNGRAPASDSTARVSRGIPQIGGPVVIHTNTEEMVAAAITSPLTMIASDAYWENGIGHPRTTGTYSRVLGRYVRDAHALTLMDAIREDDADAGAAARGARALVARKGRLRIGADADIAVFDARASSTVRPTASRRSRPKGSRTCS